MQDAPLIAVGLDAELKQSFTGQFHFGAQSQAAIAVEASDAPEIEGLAIADGFRIATTAAQAGAPDEAIDGAAQTPQPIGDVPAVATADAADGAKDGPIRCVDHLGAGIAKDGATGPIGITRNGPGHGPTCLDLVFGYLTQGRANCLANVQELLRDDSGDAVFGADDGIFEAFGQGLGDLVTEGSY